VTSYSAIGPLIAECLHWGKPKHNILVGEREVLKRTLAWGLVISCLAGSVAGQEAAAPVADPFQLGLVLKSAREYCRRLERAALDFVCLEEVSEQVDLSREKQEADVRIDPRVTSGVGGVGRMGMSGRPVTFNPSAKARSDNRYVFDYQFVRQRGQIKENRVLLEKNGRKAKPKEKPPFMNVFRCSEILLMPVQLLAEKVAEFYQYRLLREDSLDGVGVWVLDVSPRLSIRDYLGGRLWISKADASVLRIEWDPTTFGHYDSILQNAARFKEEPAVISHTDFGFEKNGVRFPSRDFTEEAYVDGSGKKFIRSQTQVIYKDYRFFTVEAETTIK
jgi:hypothetical protein